jgi:glycine cleavage system aminomethyltransferase T
VKTPDFVGKAAHVKHREQEPVAVLCTLTVDDHTSRDGTKRYMLGREPVLARDGSPLVDAHGRRSYVTSAGAGPSLGKHILMTYLPPERANVGEELLVEFLGEQYPVTVQTNDSTPVFDPENARVKA